MDLPSDFAALSVPEQVFVSVDRERVRRVPPFTGLSAYHRNAGCGAAAAGLPPDPGGPYSSVASEWIGAVTNGLDATYQWMYDDGPGTGVPHCGRAVSLLGAGPTATTSSGTSGEAAWSWAQLSIPSVTRRQATAAACLWPPCSRARPGNLHHWSTPGGAGRHRPGKLLPLRHVLPTESATGIPTLATTWPPIRTSPGSAVAGARQHTVVHRRRARRHDARMPKRASGPWSCPVRCSARPSSSSTPSTSRRALSAACHRSLGSPRRWTRTHGVEPLPPMIPPSRSRLSPRRRRVGRWFEQRARRRLRMDVRRRLRQRILDCTRLGAPGCRGHRKGILDDFGWGQPGHGGCGRPRRGHPPR